jgi:acid phosphatase
MVASDAWLASHLPRLLGLAGRRGVVILTWDEDDYSQINQILTVFAGGAVKGGTTQSTHITHFTVCRTICDALGIPPMNEAVKETPITGIWATSATPSVRRSH